MSKVVVVGGGHNGLVAAVRLASRGRQVVVVEQREAVGGVAAGESFHPGYRHTGALIDTTEVRPHVIEGLGLAAHGLVTRASIPTYLAASEGPGLLLSASAEASAPELAAHAPDDAAGYAALQAFIATIRPFAASVLDAPAPVIGEDLQLWPLAQKAIGLRRLGKHDMLELLKVAPGAARDWVSEYIRSPLLAAGLLAPGLLGTWMGPRSPQSTVAVLRHAVLAGDEIVGGPAALIRALEAAATAAGVEIRTSSRVTRVRAGAKGVSGVTLADGTDIDATAVLLAISPRSGLLDLVDPLWLPPVTARDIEIVRARGATAVLHLALSGPLIFAGRPELTVGHALVLDTPDDLERAFDDVKHRRLPRRPTLELRVPSLDDPSLAPEGHHVATVLVRGAAYDLDGGWTDAAREALLGTVLDTLGRCVPDLRDRLVGHQLLTPADLASTYGLDGGHLCHGELALDQLWVMRPAPGLSRHGTPVAGLFLGSAGTHPGGALTGASGWLAAEALLAGTGS